MLVTFVSQCEKKALTRTRRVLDAFANRIGDNAWQTAITEEGLNAVKKLLRQTASKNTAVSCHRVCSRKRSELVWIVGNKRKFNEVGVVAVNRTMKNEPLSERFALNTHVITLLSSLAGFFHDAGKANQLFQEKLTGKSEKIYEPYRHEWVSLRIFQAFVENREDKEWLTALIRIDNHAESRMFSNLHRLQDGIATSIPQPFSTLPPVARLVAWLIVSHHHLPLFTKNSDNARDLCQINTWREDVFEPCWNSPKCLDEWSQTLVEKNWHFPHGTPLLSVHWQTNVSILATKILRHERIFQQCWLDQNHTAHLARLSLMLADHHYSSDQPITKISPKWQDRNYHAYANTAKDESGRRQLKQKLDEHNIAVGIYAGKIARLLPSLRDDLPALSNNPNLSKSTKHLDFIWQNEAYDLARKIREKTKQYGFFGICKASTGKGKTLANARIMYGLSEDDSCRFNIALGLRTLTIQTANALQKDLKLCSGELAMLIGSQAIKELHQDNHSEQQSEQEQSGSASSEPLSIDDTEIIVSGVDNRSQQDHQEHFNDEMRSDNNYNGEFIQWIEHDPKILKMIEAPIMVSTIDYLMPANEGVRGGRQIAPMLRLLTSDLVLDEPDDFGLADMPALCRLVNWAGMLGSRVLLSTATIPPSLASALFCAYQAGRKHYTEVNGEQGVSDTVCCAWFDEFKKPVSELISDKKMFDAAHETFVKKRVDELKKHALPLRKAKLIDMSKDIDKAMTPSQWLTKSIASSIHELHAQHHITLCDKTVSIGLVRMANINPLVQVAKHLLQSEPPENTVIHYCIYHSQFPLIQRSAIERQLDAALTRKDESEWWQQSHIPNIIKPHSETHHVFVVLATSVAEVGRDHDYDWAIIEPSSMRSIIQLAGRIQRHRKQVPPCENIHILSTNYKGLKGVSPNFIEPGFETKEMQCTSHDLNNLDVRGDIENISSIPRITSPSLSPSPFFRENNNLVRFTSFNALEHLSQSARLFGSNSNQNYAALWWKNAASWCGELQYRQPFRKSQLQEDYCLAKPAHVVGLRWQKKVAKTYPAKYQPTDDIATKEEQLTITKGNTFWCDTDIDNELAQLAQRLGKSPDTLMQTFTHLSLRQNDKNTDEQWHWHNNLGIFKRIKKDRWQNG